MTVNTLRLIAVDHKAREDLSITNCSTCTEECLLQKDICICRNLLASTCRFAQGPIHSISQETLDEGFRASKSTAILPNSLEDLWCLLRNILKCAYDRLGELRIWPLVNTLSYHVTTFNSLKSDLISLPESRHVSLPHPPCASSQDYSAHCPSTPACY
ncbi:hypothetical protein BDY19DRAFT_107064 [Irpex rosettiformis]|uniref:Uncharacterized protein n=1 Tax=Irpex rosettiformis TaxID=378272 RepID=A0ACB8U538_9APHY|nr:hypothetical protein BDY19DRAFT_107064 [Irpex rosettiformis]